MELNKIYKQLTSVDIETQKKIWDERGKGYYGEYLVFCELYRFLSGTGKILMNLNIPASTSSTTEIDLILIHETGLYVFEIKHYKGTIYGKSSDAVWTQYFKTTRNHTFKNPIEQNRYHICALKNMFPNVPIHSCIVFTNDDCDIRVENTYSEIDVFHLQHMNQVLSQRIAQSAKLFSMEEIDLHFSTLSPYSQMQTPVEINGVEADFLSWVTPVVSRLENENNNLITEQKKLKKARQTGIIFNIAAAIVCAAVAFGAAFYTIRQKDNELSAFKQNFLHVDAIGNEYIDRLNSYVKISNISLLPLTEDAVSFTARIAVSNDIYGILLTESSKYIVMTESGKIFEYDVFGEHLRYSKYGNMIGKNVRVSADLAPVQFYGISDISEITYIKITDITLYKTDISNTVVKEHLEIELYSAD